MVGVPGRSKACHNCRARKLKTDIQTNLPWPPPAADPGTSRRWTYYVAAPEDDSAPLLKSPDLRVHEQGQLIARFIENFCPELDRSLNECERRHHCWAYVLPYIHGTVDLLDRSILTLSAAFLGTVVGDERLRKRSMVMYGQAISDLTKVMSAANFYPTDTVLAAIMCLGMSEVSGI
ncbi:unnamed protein product [Clonostachys chloroleuca]|uniref:Uncharacterized protein n=1 Tax=Clonostachys chloroleuca TaxID=1926264 RepID=A0AA35PYC7_9HYPO|nr:unnamed protein product [Clonostachys chloroleuca]CAI6074238.1 unnamed protein product [Clonostachys chloroleuca]CAI6074335.1 unnamed protein product [Clonostachys chloroleuca]CAI6077544.1 unnamed protein product [Clonostachys chloroleuca]